MSRNTPYRPLADRMRPATLDEFYGQEHILGTGKPLRSSIESGHLHSMVFWGPPGTGKTTLARIIANSGNARFLTMSAVLGGIKEIRQAIDHARQYREMSGQDSVLFVDEVHRFNKAQQDAFLPHIEDGTIMFIGATTENPSFELNNALLSRLRVYVLKLLESTHLQSILQSALEDTGRSGLRSDLQLDAAASNRLVEFADGDARRALNLLEVLADLAGDMPVTVELVDQVIHGGSIRRFDKGGDIFYDQISALHKSVRGSSPDAALYWFVRLIDGGCDPLYIARRVVRMASEDIGNADPRAMRIALDAWEIQEKLGSPEGELALAQAVIYLACAPKSNAVYKAYNAAMKDIVDAGSLEVPLRLRNAPTALMKQQEYGKGYRYAHDETDAYAAGEHYFPDKMEAKQYYYPVNHGLEQAISEKLDRLRKLDRQARDRK